MKKVIIEKIIYEKGDKVKCNQPQINYYNTDYGIITRVHGNYESMVDWYVNGKKKYFSCTRHDRIYPYDEKDIKSTETIGWFSKELQKYD